MTKPSTIEIDRVLNWTYDAMDEARSNFPGMSYEDGVRAAIEWLQGEVEDAPDDG